MDDEMQAFEVRDYEIERLLESYARARLQPDPAATARTRARVMREARLQFDAARIAVHMAPAIAAQVSHRSMTKRLAMPLFAASVWLGIAVGSISAAQAGGPLYPTRMWVENAALPGAGMSRATAELGRLDARLAEAYTASVRGDAAAVQAALDAYRSIADETLAAVAGNADLEAMVSVALDKHRAVLTAVAAGLAEKGNTTAAAAVEASIARAIARNQEVVDRVKASGSTGGNGDANGSAGSGSNAGGTSGGTGANNGGGGQGGTDSTSTPAGTGGDGNSATPAPGGGGGGPADKPEKTPKPTPDHPKPSPTDPEPDHTPRGNH